MNEPRQYAPIPHVSPPTAAEILEDVAQTLEGIRTSLLFGDQTMSIGTRLGLELIVGLAALQSAQMRFLLIADTLKAAGKS